MLAPTYLALVLGAALITSHDWPSAAVSVAHPVLTIAAPIIDTTCGARRRVHAVSRVASAPVQPTGHSHLTEASRART